MNILLAVVLAASAWTSEILLEAEEATLIGVEVDDTREGFSGTGYVTGFDAPEDSLRFHVETGEGIYELHLSVALSRRAGSFSLWIDGVPYTGSLFVNPGAFIERSLGEYRLSEGSHTLVIKGSFDVDYLKLMPVEYDPPAPPPAQLADPNATPATQALFNFLISMYGDSILAGQQELRYVDFIRETTGKEPAIAGGDLIEYSPSRWERGARPNYNQYASAEDIIGWAGQDGIVSLMWHWNAPTDLIDSDDQPWWRGFYTEATTFNFATALADPASERYALMLRDIDSIAVQLQKFEDADIPVLWRPLHEAAGGWFWWGAQGPAPFVELWRLLYDRLVNHHGLHNLIWVYTHEPNAFDWYPGDDVVDVVSRDVYANDPAATMRGEWNELQEFYGDRKLIALSESGTLPAPEVITDFGIWWSWFAVWSGDFIETLDADYLQHVFTSEHVLTRDELPAWRDYTTDTAPPLPVPSRSVALYPNPSAGPATLRMTLPTTADVRVEVFDVLGRQVRAYAFGVHPTGTFETIIEPGTAAGLYVVRVVAGSYVEHQSLIVTR